ncbi:lytic transglycosylase domain-containing protein [Campylobacter sp. 19-13652]|uniref:lytic transglycosylase domain-containing protein n=1 Tax=Campylobacter sp. 19-13652 TaxID=2840180 RepID=UPI001C754AFE|nr:lytic transglycosylase domain-containing protein [Campylobacter sp. 19-13652]BCX79066.1 lytic transglycosylase [Campylobacter sp. 19-13652]
MRILKIFSILTFSIQILLASASSDLELLKELDINPDFAKTIYFEDIKNDIKVGHIRDFDESIQNAKSYIDMLKNTVQSSGVPPTLFYLAMVESGLSNRVISGAKAAGIWQFMESTARLYGLRVDKYVDERKDPQRSSQAATKYLRSLKREFGKWYLAILAYNCGNTKLRKAISQAGSDDLAVLLDPSKKYLPSETRRFIGKILRQAIIASDLGFSVAKEDKANSLKLSKISVPGGTSLVEVADSIGVGVNRLKEYNAHIKLAFTPPNSKNYHLYIPQNRVALFTKNFTPKGGKNEFFTYKVKKGDTLLSIAEKTGVNTRAIKDYNELSTNSVALNQSLVIPKIVQPKTLSSGSEIVRLDMGRKKGEILNSKEEIASGEHIAIP